MATLGDLTLNPTTGVWEQTQTFDPGVNQWAWGSNGLSPLGGQAEYGFIDPFLGVNEQYRGGAPVTANTWQDAVRQSLEGFMRINYGVDPIYNWDQAQSGREGSQYQLGTLSELANKLPSFFNTGNITQNAYTGEVGYGHGLPSYDPLIGLDPSTKLLAFEDVPLEQIEQAIGGLPGRLFNMQLAAPYQATIREQSAKRAALDAQINQLMSMPSGSGTQQSSGMQSQVNPENLGWLEMGQRYKDALAGGAGGAANNDARIQELRNQVGGIDKLIEEAKSGLGQNAFVSLEQARNDPRYKDWNDFLFKLDIDQYTPPPEVIKASPESVLKKFFDTPEYRLAFGNDPNVLDPSKDPTERFKFDPGYEFSQQEGFRQLQNRGAARGLLESGPMQRDLQQYSQGLADQNYQRWMSQNVGLFEKWQNSQAQLAAMGPQINGSQAALQTGNSLASLSSQQGTQAANILNQLGLAGLGAYGQLGQSGMGAFSNLGTAGLNAFSQLGQSGLNNLTQAGIAQGNNMTQAAIAQAQLQSQQGGGFGQIAGQLAGQLMGGGGGSGGGGGFF